MKYSIFEIILGAVILVVAIGFTLFGASHIGLGPQKDTYQLKARFVSVAGVTIGTDVRVAGVRVGKVVGQDLDPETFEGVLTFQLPKSLELSIDSEAKIASQGIMGGSFVTLIPGVDSVALNPGESFNLTTESTDLFDLLQGAVFTGPSGGLQIEE